MRYLLTAVLGLFTLGCSQVSQSKEITVMNLHLGDSTYAEFENFLGDYASKHRLRFELFDWYEVDNEYNFKIKLEFRSKFEWPTKEKFEWPTEENGSLFFTSYFDKSIASLSVDYGDRKSEWLAIIADFEKEIEGKGWRSEHVEANASGYAYEKYAVPKEIYSLMKAKECSPISGFYDRSVYAPPFVYKTNSPEVFFACQIDNAKTEDRYKIVIQLTRQSVYSDFQKCPSEIFFREMPGGLSLNFNVGDLKQRLNLWQDTRRYRRTENIDIPPEHKPQWLLDALHDGVGVGFVCADGHWYNVVYH